MGPVILLSAVIALQLAPAPALAAGGTLAVDNVTVGEPPEAGPRALVFTVNLARSDADPVTVDYATVDGTATAGSDFVATAGTLDFGTAATNRTVSVLVLGDGIDETDETFALRLSGASTGQTQLDATATIVDADPAPRLSIAAARVAEGAGGPGSGPDAGGLVDATFAVSLSEPSGRPVTVDYRTTDGAGPDGATAPADYTATSGTLTFNPGEQVKAVVVPVVADGLDEADELFGVALSRSEGATIGVAAATGTIADDDRVPALSVEDATAAEGAGKLTFTVSIDHPSSRNVTFRVMTADGPGPNPAVAPGDYAAVSSTPAQIPAGQTSVGIDVMLTGDSVHEAAETFSLVLSSEANAVPARPVATGTITDDDPGSDLSVDDVSVSEGTLVGPGLVFTVTLSAPAGTPVTVEYATSDGTGVAAPKSPDQPDYRAASGTLTFQPAQTSKTVTVFPNHDDRPEGSETVLLRLSNPSPGIPLARPVGTGTITDDDGPADELVVKDTGFAEGDTGTAAHLFTVTRVRRTGAPAAAALPVTVRFATADGTAHAGSDYTPRTGVLVFAGTITTRTVSVSVTGDAVSEEDETIKLVLSSPTNAVLGLARGDAGTGGDSSGSAGIGTATIRNDDAAPVVSVAPVSFPEGHSGAGRAEAVVTLSSPSSRPITVGYALGGDGSSASPSADFVADSPSGTLTFAPGETTKPLGLSVVADTIDEPDETIAVVLSNPAGARLAAAAPSGRSFLTITDDDAPPRLSVNDETIGETDAARRALDFTIVLDSVGGLPVTVTVTTADGPPAGGATAPADYGALRDRVVTIPPGARAATVPVSVTDDPARDGAPSETFTVVLSSPTNATLAGASATGTIVDDDGPLTVAIAGSTVTEGTGSVSKPVARFLVTLSKPAAAPVAVTYSTGAPDDTATSPDDYTSPGADLTFGPGETVKAVDFPIAADTLDEPDETFTVRLTGVAVPAGDGAAGPEIDPVRSGATARIVDDEGPNVTVADVEVAEGNSGAGRAVFTITLDAATPQPVTVAYATAGGTAFPGADYTPQSGTLEYAAGETSRDLAIPVVGDGLDEADEVFLLTLAAPAGATVSTGAARAVIADDDLPQLDIADAAIAEGDTGTGTVAFTVTLTPPAADVVTVAFTTADGSAVAGQDYGAAAGQITFNPGDSVRTMTTTVASDTSDLGDENFTVTLSAAGAGARLARAVATGTIIDDDSVPEIFSPDVTATETTGEDTTAVFPVRLSAPRSFPVTVRYDTPAGTATAGTDFVRAGGALTFAPGDEVQPVSVPVLEDSRYEGGETIRLRLSGAGNGALDDPEATATILDDDQPAYFMAGADGGVFPFGGARFLGSAGHLRLNSPIVGLAAHPSGRGYWMVATDGGIFAFGAARFHGSTGGRRLNRPIVAMAATPSGNGYWLVSTDGGVFAFGDARYFGSTGGSRLNKPIVGLAPTPSGDGYWLVATDGGLFAFGDARFFGSTGATALNRSIVGMAATPSGDGYWLVASDGGIFAFGDARFFGSTGALRLNKPIVGMTPVPSGGGYWLVATDGGIFAFGDATFNGSTGALRINRPVIGMATL